MPEVLTDDITQMIKDKASLYDIRRLQEEKTNKEDTESQMRNMEVIHKMLATVSVLLAEHLRGVASPKLQSEPERLKVGKQLHDKAVIVQRWI